MAITAATIWEVRPTGDDTFGGGRDATYGVDYSQQNTAQVVIDNATITATCNGTTITFTGGTYTVSSNDRYNVVNMISGTGLTAKRYLISSVTTGLNGTWVLDSTTGMSGGAVTSAKMGGALASPGVIGGQAVAGNVAYLKTAATTLSSGIDNSVTSITVGSGSDIKNNGYILIDDELMLVTAGGGTTSLTVTRAQAGTTAASHSSGVALASVYLITTASTNVSNGCTSNASNYGGMKWVGYTSTRTIAIRSTIRPVLMLNSSVSTATIIQVSSYAGVALNLSFHGNSQTTSKALGSNMVGVNCKFYKFTASPSPRSLMCELSTCTTGYGAWAVYCSAHHCTTNTPYPGTFAVFCVGYSNSGAHVFGNSAITVNCIAYSNTGSYNAFNDCFLAINCIAVSNGQYGFAPVGYDVMINCAHYGNSSGGVNYASYTPVEVNTIALSGDPFVGAASNDFRLNNTAGRGADCRAIGIPSFPLDLHSNTATYIDVGAFQHQDAAGSAGIMTHPGMSGGMRG